MQQRDVEIKVEAAKVSDGEVAEEVDPLDRRGDESVVQRQPGGLALAYEGRYIGVAKEEVRPARVRATNAVHQRSVLRGDGGDILPCLYDHFRDGLVAGSGRDGRRAARWHAAPAAGLQRRQHQRRLYGRRRHGRRRRWWRQMRRRRLRRRRRPRLYPFVLPPTHEIIRVECGDASTLKHSGRFVCPPASALSRAKASAAAE